MNTKDANEEGKINKGRGGNNVA